MIGFKSHSFIQNFNDLIRTAETYNLFVSKDEQDIVVIANEYKIFKTVSENKVFYNIFYENLHIRMETSPKEYIYSIHLKKHEDDWEFIKNKNIDYSIPVISTYRIYIAYDVPVLNITRSVGDAYIHGSWDEYVYRTLQKLFAEVNNYNEIVQFNKWYK
jgi:hypothetical protein